MEIGGFWNYLWIALHPGPPGCIRQNPAFKNVIDFEANLQDLPITPCFIPLSIRLQKNFIWFFPEDVCEEQDLLKGSVGAGLWILSSAQALQ
jgi:hypothetical protein